MAVPGKRSAAALGTPDAKRTKTGGATMSFAERMMRKQGWSEGQSLGKTGNEGIREAIQVKLRPTGAGLGAVKEMTAQAKAEARRKSEARGEEYESSGSESDRHSRRQRFNPSIKAAVAPASRPSFNIGRIEIPEVPSIFFDILEAEVADEDIERGKVKKAAQRELEAYDHAWRELQNRKVAASSQEADVSAASEQFGTIARSIHDIAQILNSISLASDALSQADQATDAFHLQKMSLSSQVQELYNAATESMDMDELASIAVAAIQPTFDKMMRAWEPFDASTQPQARAAIELLHDFFALCNTNESDLDGMRDKTQQAIPSAYDSMLIVSWLPQVREAVSERWDPSDPETLLQMVKSWEYVLTPRMLDVIINHVVVDKLIQKVKSWDPSQATSGGVDQPELHRAIFPWMEYLDDYQLDSRSSDGLLASVRRQLRSCLDHWNLSKGIMTGLESWLQVKWIRKHLRHDLESRLLPRFGQMFKSLEIDPADQDITLIETYLAWGSIFATDKFIRPLNQVFFPKLQEALESWLAAEPNYVEIGQWIEWWQSVFAAQLRHVAMIATAWTHMLGILNEALSMGAGKQQSAGPLEASSASHAAKSNNITEAVNISEQDVDFKSLVEEMCEAQSLYLKPRGAHPEVGCSLFELTEGPKGRMVMLKDDVLWMEDRKDKGRWQPVDIFEDMRQLVLER